MGRYSPTVLPNQETDFGAQLGDAASTLAQGLEARRQKRRQETSDKEAEEDRGRLHTHQDEEWSRAREQAARQKILDAVSLYNTGYRENAGPTAGQGDVAGALEAQRGNRVLQGNGVAPQAGQGPPPVQTGARGTGAGEWGNMLQGQSGVTGSMGRVPTEDARDGVQPSADYGDARYAAGDPEDQGISTPLYPPDGSTPVQTGARGAMGSMNGAPHPMTQIGQKFYLPLPGGAGYIDPEQTPEARQQRVARENEDYEYGHRRELAGTEHGYRTEEEGGRYQHDVDLEGMRGRNQLTQDRAKYRHEDHQTGLETDRAVQVARIRAGGTSGNDGPTGPKTLDARGRMIGRQISDRSRALNEEGEELSYQADPDSSNYHRIASELDSLRGVQDQVTSARGGSPNAVRQISRQMNTQSYQQEVDALASRRARLLAKAAGNPEMIARINQAYGTDVNGISRKYGSVLGDH
jgi:hypothetical protein